ncbi:hypothetical protein BEP19_05905 [Ammoniphilus oxalaticus]|uniref:Amine oxidase domain-containing protein n=1 Tax=Ammoniphilus oxalaticus TaxID=66863 RepID=A0A419SIW8_9BACL|nr:FAD-dependent oxidoreductase [Ammoniphilus oxalaticus]RKD23953.1 hypothetical protein BEP19_05905 [Ammoniphilus oxalaticus]
MGFSRAPIVVIGGGISGIMAARTLIDSGEENVLLLERSRDLGGRMTTREFAGAKFDHGSQYFTAQTELFKKVVANWKESGWIEEFSKASNSFIGSGGMTALIRQLADPIDFCLRVRVTKVQQGRGRWILRWVSEGKPYVPQTYKEVASDEVYDPGGGASINARAIIMTTPVPQTMFLLEQGNNELDSSVKSLLATIEYEPCLAIMFTIEGDHLLSSGYAGGDLPDPLYSIVDNKKKGISPIPSLTIQASESWSKQNFWNTSDELAAELTKAAEPWIGKVNIEEKQVKRWTFSRAKQKIKQPFLDAGFEYPLVFAGDAFGQIDQSGQLGGVETAVLSGIEAANYLLEQLKN